jgi:hypothetical protein
MMDEVWDLEVAEPELGRAVFGQEGQEFRPSKGLMHALRALSHTWRALDPMRSPYTPFDNSGSEGDYDGEKFQVHAYSWGDDEQPFNFAWRDLRVSWYKHSERDVTCNRAVSQEEIREMLAECLNETLTKVNP